MARHPRTSSVRSLASSAAPFAVASVAASRRRARERADMLWDGVSPPVVCVFGAGAAPGAVWHTGVAEALVGLGVDPHTAPLVGTSAGSWVATMTRLGVPFDAAVDALLASSLDRRPGVLEGVGRELFGDEPAPGVTVCATRAATASRRLLDGSQHRAADLVAASSAVPGVFAPHRVDGVWYVDGGLRSPCSVSALPHAQLAVVSLPPRGFVSARGADLADRAAQRSIVAWQRRHRSEVLVLRCPAHLSAKFAERVRTPFDIAAAASLIDEARAVAALEVAQHAALISSYLTPPQ